MEYTKKIVIYFVIQKKIYTFASKFNKKFNLLDVRHEI